MNWNLIVLLSSLSALLIACGGNSEVGSESVIEATKAATVAATTSSTQVATVTATVAPTATPTETVEENLSEYVVVGGDNLTDIAARYGLTLAQLRALNPDVEGDVIWVGQVLKVTGDPPPATATAAPAAATAAPAAATAAPAAATAAPAAATAAPAAATAAPAAATAAPAAATAAPATQSGSGQPPFVPYGTNASPNAVVTASANGVICATTTADGVGQWFFKLEDSCATPGTEITFTSGNKKGTAEYATGAGADIFLDF
jgi:LysM repeat protein